MTILYFTGFEHGSLGDSGWKGGYCSINSVTKRTGNYSLRSNPPVNESGYAQYVGFTNTTGAAAQWNAATVYFRFYLYIATMPASGNSQIFRTVDVSGQSKISLRINSSGNLMAFANNDSTQIGSTGTATLSTGVWYRIEGKSPTGLSAAIEIKVDGTVDITGTGSVSTDNNSGVTFGRYQDSGNPAIDVYFDDVAINDSEYPGVGATLRLDPDGNGTYTAWTGDVPNWQQVDEVPPSGGDYLTSTISIGAAESVTLESCANAGVNDTIKAVIGLWAVQRYDVGASMKFRFRSGSTDTDTANAITTSAGIGIYGMLFTTDPATSAAWTSGGVDGVEIGVIEQSASVPSFWISGYLMVEFGPSAAPAGMGQVI